VAKRDSKSQELHWNDESVEPYRILHSHVFAGRGEAPMCCVLFTANQRGEGCSTISSNMAIFLSKVQEGRVLLLELNLAHPARRPVVPAVREVGVVQVVRGESSLEDAVQRVGENLDVLAAGCGPEGLTGSVSESGLSDLLGRLKRSYSHVVVDAPTVSGTPSMKLLAPRADGVVLVTRANETRRHVAARSVRELRGAGANLLGVALNQRRHFIPRWLYRSL